MRAEELLKGVGVVAAVIMIGVGMWLLNADLEPGAAVPKEGPWTLDLEKLGAIDPGLRTWTEVETINPGSDRLFGIAARGDLVYVTGDRQLVVFSSGSEIRRIELENEAMCLDVARDGVVYLGMSGRIEVRDREMRVIRGWDLPSPRSRVTAIAVGDSGVYVADAGHRVVRRFDADGTLLGTITGDGGFSVPSPHFDLAVGYEGHLWAVDPGKHLIKNFLDDGTLRSVWGSSSPDIEGFCGCCNPTNFTIFDDGAFVTSEKGLCRVKVYAPSGKLESVVAGPRDFEAGTLGLDLAVDGQGRVLVLDPTRRLVRIFARKGAA